MAEYTAPAVQRGVVPYVNVKGAAEASAFYQRAFGAKELTRLPADDGKRLMHCVVEINGGQLMMSDTFPEHGYDFQPSHSFTMHLNVEDIDSWWNRAVEAGAEVVLPLQLMFWGDRYGQLKDPFGVRWSMNEPVKAG
jgi:uncharacterized glyoxalase superfamily protein PhnB